MIQKHNGAQVCKNWLCRFLSSSSRTNLYICNL